MTGRARFKSMRDAQQSSIRVWTCQHCGIQHRKTKPKMCKNCGVGAFHYFASVGEANKYAELALLQAHGQINGLRLQVPFRLYHTGPGTLGSEKLGKPVVEYRADFVYCTKGGDQVVVDYKGDTRYTDPVFDLKRKLIEPVYEIEIKLV